MDVPALKLQVSPEQVYVKLATGAGAAIVKGASLASAVAEAASLTRTFALVLVLLGTVQA